MLHIYIQLSIIICFISKKTVAVCSENHTEPIVTLCGQNTQLLTLMEVVLSYQ
jgi:hypothetical protein